MSARYRVLLWMALFCAWFLVRPVPELAQVQTGRIVGTITDPTGAVVPGASITVVEVATNISHPATSERNGEYVVTPLNAGAYVVTVKMSGFQTVVGSGIDLQVGQVAQIDITLQLGDANTQVRVTAEAPLVETESGVLGQVINTQEIVDLPLNGRDFYELGRLTPGAELTPSLTTFVVRPDSTDGMVVNGVSGRATTFLIDGVDVTDQHQGGTLIQVSIDALQEFNFQGNGYSAEFRRAGGVYNATTKSGTNEVHGTLFEFLRNNDLDARDFFGAARGVLKRNQFGGVVGGPLSVPKLYNGKNRTFLMLNYEGYRQAAGVPFTDVVPSTAMLQGDFSAPGLSRIYDPLSTVTGSNGVATRTPFPGNIIPQSELASPSVMIAKYLPPPNLGSNEAVFTLTEPTRWDQTTVRLDQQLSTLNHLFSRWTYVDTRENDPLSFPSLGTAPLRARAQNIAAGFTSTISPTLVQDFRFNMLFMNIQLGTFLSGTDWNKVFGIQGFEQDSPCECSAENGTFPQFSFSGYTTLNTSNTYPPKTQNHLALEFMDSLTKVMGRQTLKVGAMVRRNRPLFTDTKFYQGTSSYTGVETQNPASAAGTGNSIADFMLGYPFSVERTTAGNTFGGLGVTVQGFMQDDIRARSNLTINVGLRYEYNPWMEGWEGQLGTFDGNSARPLIISGYGDQINLTAQPAEKYLVPLYQNLIQTSTQAGLPYQITQNDNRQFGPRFGFAWQPFGPRTVIRGGYGIYYEPEYSDLRVNLNMVPFELAETVFNTQGALPTLTIANPFLGQPIGTNLGILSLSPTYTHMKMASDEPWNVGIQRELSKSLVLEAEYVANKGSHIYGTNNANNPLPGPGAVQARRPYQQWGTIAYFSMDESSSYQSFQGKIEKRYSSGFSFLASYTFSKAMINQNSPAAGGEYYFETSLAGFNVPQNLAFTGSYQLPFGKGKPFLASSGRLLNGLVGGWQMQGIAGYRTGLPFTPTISTDVANIGVSSQRPNRVAGCSGTLPSPTPNDWFNQSCFTVPAAYTYGNSGANILHGGPVHFVNFSLFKEFSLTEKMRLQFRGEAFNLTNTPSFNPPGGAIDVASGAKVTASSNPPRQLQFALKLMF